MKLDLKDLKVDYPTKWEYKIITKVEHKIEDILFDVLDREYSILKQNSSKSSKFISHTISIMAQDKEDKDAVFLRIHEHTKVYMVL